MLELRDIRKQYVTASLTQTALDGVSVAFRDCEFVAVLGPSGSGKTTMLNVIGGLDHFDSGDLLIDGISTKDFKDRDWDAYRNNRVGFVFQSYNLIPHQTVLQNVELALTLSGVSRRERRQRALDALARVGLAEHADKHPSQLSGGQMQRVAIARALVNEPEIILADEPTGALDSATSVQVMDLLKEVARDRLVVMVTHNPELARQYATRIVELRDGHITSDSDPFDPATVPHREARPARRTSMSFLTALGLSFNNLMTKKGRTLLTAFAGSIGIIGIAAILALASGVNQYINDTEEEMLSVYPLQISRQSMNLSSMMASGAQDSQDAQQAADQGSGSSDDGSGEVGTRALLGRLSESVGTNDLRSLKAYLDANGGGIDDQVSDIEYLYDVTPQIFLPDTSDGAVQVNPDTTASQLLGSGSLMSMSTSTSTNYFRQMPSERSLFESQYDVKAGRWPEAWDELVVVLTADGKVSDMVAYDLGLRDRSELDDIVAALSSGESSDIDTSTGTYSYDQILSTTLRVVPSSSLYAYDPSYGVWTSKTDDASYMASLVDGAETLKVVGIVQPSKPDEATALSSGVYYTPALTDHLIDEAAQSDVVADQLARPDVDVLTGQTFADEAAGTGESGLDLSSIVSVDTDAISRAFSFDTSSLQVDLSGLDLSGIDASQVQLPAFDPSTLDLSGLAQAAPDLTADQLAGLFPELTGDQLSQVLSQVQVHYVDGGQERLQQALGQVVQGYFAWSADNPDKTVADYLAQDDVRQQVTQAVEQSVDTTDLESQLADALAGVLGTQASDDAAQTAAGITNEAMQRILGAYEQQLAQALQQTVTTAVSTYLQAALASVMGQLTTQLQAQLQGAMQQTMARLAQSMSSAMHVDADAIASAFQVNMDETQLRELLTSMMGSTSSTYESNLAKLGYADKDDPYEIDIYPRDFDTKANVVKVLDDYNQAATDAGEDDKVISYTDMVGTMMNSVKRIVDMISTMLVAFVSISLVVSSIMIAIITYISVLERKKEIGILRSIGASKHNVSSVFNAETVIEGLVAGLMGVGITLLISIPANVVIEQQFAVHDLMRLPPLDGLVLVGISVLLTFVAGLIPAAKASHADPVEALRSE